MTEEQKDRVLADCLEEYHRQRARGEAADLPRFREQLGDLYEEFFELVAAETAIDEALDSVSEQALPQNWGPYLLLGEVGRGAAGVVYEAMHRQLGRKVALKVLRAGVDTDDTARERFRREAQALAQVRHDNIVEIYEFGEIGDRLFYAMSLVEGPTLSSLNKSDQRPTPEALCTGLAGVAEALHALHEAGIVHRDVKPSNIMIAPDGRYVLADFGLARTDLAETMTKTGDALGTPLYMSPEQMLGKRDGVEARTDVYGLGATLYQLLSGQPPFKTDNLHALMRMVLTQRPQSPRSVAPDLPPGCSRIAMKCLEKEAGDRYASAADLADDLRAFAGGERVSGKPLTGTQRGMRLIQRRPLVSALAAAATVLVAVGAWALIAPADPALLTVRVAERATVDVDGSVYAAPVLKKELELGRMHHVIVRPEASGYLPVERTYKPERTADIELDVPGFQPADLSNRAVIEKTIEGFGVKPTQAVGELEQHRGPAKHDLEVVWPRGKVRKRDLDELLIRVNVDFDPEIPAVLEFRRGDELLHSQPFPDPDLMAFRMPMPSEVLEKVQPGDKIAWGYTQPARHRGRKLKRLPLHHTTFTLVEEEVEHEVDERLAQIDERLKLLREKADWTAESLAVVGVTAKAELLLSAGLAQAAYKLVSAAIGGYVVEAPEPGQDPEVVTESFVRGEYVTQGLVELERKILHALYPSKRDRDEAALYRTQHKLVHRKLFEEDEWKAFEARQADAAGK